MDWKGWSCKLSGTLARPLLPRLLPLGPYEESCLSKPYRIQRGSCCEDCRYSRRYPGLGTSVENVDLSSHSANASSDVNSRILFMVTFRDVTGMKDDHR
ncbi:hypothetical protein TNCV_2233501 [Trichonephila clavipes]|nr:hypothetical protein TNCV_2233501 [Trichonephila clavipes]